MALSDRSVHICFIGGCHVEGYIVGKDNSFPRVVAKTLQDARINPIVTTHGPLAFKNVASIKRILAADHPDVLVLQMGNHEGSPSIIRGHIKKLKKKLGHTKLGPCSSSTEVTPTIKMPVPSAEYRLSIILRIKYFFKKPLHYIFGSLLFPRKVISTQIIEFFRVIHDAHIPCVIVLGSLHNCDPTIDRYRRILSQLTDEYLHRFNSHIHDTTPLFSGHQDLFLPDGAHLNIKGHSALGLNVSREVLAELSH